MLINDQYLHDHTNLSTWGEGQTCWAGCTMMKEAKRKVARGCWPGWVPGAGGG